MNDLDCLTEFQKRLVLSLLPEGSAISQAEWMQPMRPCPVAVDVRVPGEVDLKRVVLRRARNRGGVDREAFVLPELTRFGLPVPQILAKPVTDPLDNTTVSVLSFLPGIRLQDFALYPEEPLPRTKELAVESIKMLHKATDFMMASPAAPNLPRRTLYDEWAVEKEKAGSWKARADYTEALQQVEGSCRLAAERTPLVFSNGDYQPGNFLTDGEKITGLLDFEKAGFLDPLINVARYPVYGIEPLEGAGVTHAFCEANGFTPADLALRVVVFGLRTLRTKFAPDDSQARVRTEFRDQLLALIHRALHEIKDNP